MYDCERRSFCAERVINYGSGLVGQLVGLGYQALWGLISADRPMRSLVAPFKSHAWAARAIRIGSSPFPGQVSEETTKPGFSCFCAYVML